MIYCCNQSPASMDHVIGFHEDAKKMVNRVCLKCWRHWYGEAGVAVVEMPRKVWDNWIEQA